LSYECSIHEKGYTFAFLVGVYNGDGLVEEGIREFVNQVVPVEGFFCDNVDIVLGQISEVEVVLLEEVLQALLAFELHSEQNALGIAHFLIQS